MITSVTSCVLYSAGKIQKTNYTSPERYDILQTVRRRKPVTGHSGKGRGHMNTMDVIKGRRSVRTFDGRALTDEDRTALIEYSRSIRNPYDIPVEFVFLDAAEHGLSSPVIAGEKLYVAGKVAKKAHAEEAFGFSFEKLVLFAWSLGVGTTWIGGTMSRGQFEKAAGLKAGEMMPCVSPLGYPAKKMSVRETLMRKGVKADERKNAAALFFDGDFSTPLTAENENVMAALEMVRLAPSAVNRQPWRIVRIGSAYAFYLQHAKGYVSEATGDLQKVDLGIALCHFMSGAEGECKLKDPGLETEKDLEYIATVVLSDRIEHR